MLQFFRTLSLASCSTFLSAFVFLICDGALIRNALAESKEAAATLTLIEVRAVQASGWEGDEKVVRDDVERNFSGPAPIIDSRLADVAARLRKLRYRHFKLISAVHEQLPLLKKAVLDLAQGHRISVRPLSLCDKGVTLWMKWKDPQGDYVFDSKIKLMQSDAVVVGTETDHDGLILVVRARQIAAASGSKLSGKLSENLSMLRERAPQVNLASGH